MVGHCPSVSPIVLQLRGLLCSRSVSLLQVARPHKVLSSAGAGVPLQH